MSLKRFYKKQAELLGYHLKHIIGVSHFEYIHELDNSTIYTRETDNSTLFHNKYYSFVNGDLGIEFLRIYESLIRDGLNISNDYYYQSIPNLRIHKVGNLGVGEIHRDKDFGHSEHEINFILPFTNMKRTAAPFLITTGQYEYLEANKHEIVKFDGANIYHGNMINSERYTRVSIDFRIIHKDKYEQTHGKSAIKTVNGVKTFKLGDYWKQ